MHIFISQRDDKQLHRREKNEALSDWAIKTSKSFFFALTPCSQHRLSVLRLLWPTALGESEVSWWRYLEWKRKAARSWSRWLAILPIKCTTTSDATTYFQVRFKPFWIENVVHPSGRYKYTSTVAQGDREVSQRLQKALWKIVFQISCMPGFQFNRLDKCLEPIVEWTENWEPALCVQIRSLKVADKQFHPIVWAAFILERYHPNLFSGYTCVKMLGNQTWYMGVWDSLSSLFVLQSKSTETCWQMSSYACRQGFSILFFSFANRNIYGKCYTILVSFSGSIALFIPRQRAEAMKLSINAACRSLTKFYRCKYVMLNLLGCVPGW